MLWCRSNNCKIVNKSYVDFCGYFLDVEKETENPKFKQLWSKCDKNRYFSNEKNSNRTTLCAAV